jgi:mRNA interferase RelE/StbE
VRYALSRSAARYLDLLGERRRNAVLARLHELCESPFDPRISKSLHGDLASARSSRVGDLRIVFEVMAGRLRIYVIRIGPRGDVYKR